MKVDRPVPRGLLARFVIAAASVLAIIITPAAALAAGPRVPVRAEVDISASVSGPIRGVPGGGFVYTATLQNDGSTAADGARFTDSTPEGATVLRTTCTTSSGTRCVVGKTTGRVAGVLVTFPAGGRATLEIHGRFSQAEGATSAVNHIQLDPPDGTDEATPESNAATATSAVFLREAATEIDVRAEFVGGTWPERGATTFRATLTNRGPADAQRVSVSSTMSTHDSALGAVEVSGGRCRSIGRATCPSVPTAGSTRIPCSTPTSSTHR